MIRLIGLGKMGMNLFENMIDNDIDVLAYDIDTSLRDQSIYKDKIVSSISSLIDGKPGIYWMMLPQGEITEEMFTYLLSSVPANSIIIDAGNAHYMDSRRRYEIAKEYQISFVDIGVSGGKSGARYGACMMIGGDRTSYLKLEDYLKILCVDNGCLYVGEAGSGHYLKMIHNGIEYGMMQAIAEGFNIIQQNDRYSYDLHDVSVLFNHGSVIRSWLMELLANAFSNNPTLKNIQGIVESSGEGKWTLEEALRLGLNTPVIAQSLFVRFASKDEEKFGERVTATLRNEFGGHEMFEKR